MLVDGREDATARCILCGALQPAVDLDDAGEIREAIPAYSVDSVMNARTFRVGRLALLHHVCTSPQVNSETPWWHEDRSWWACLEPSRALDADAHFDLNCPSCAVRWASSLSPRR